MSFHSPRVGPGYVLRVCDAWSAAPAPANRALLDCLIHSGEADEAVDDAARCVRLPEVETDELGDEIEFGDGDEAPVEPTDDDEDGCQDVQLLHDVSSLFSVCIDYVERIAAPYGICQGYV